MESDYQISYLLFYFSDGIHEEKMPFQLSGFLFVCFVCNSCKLNTSKVKYFNQNFSIASLTKVIKIQCELNWKKKKKEEEGRRKFPFSPAPLVMCLKFNILIKDAFSWKELRYKQSLIYTSRSWGKITQTKQEQSSLFYIISFFSPHGWGYLSQSNQPCTKKTLHFTYSPDSEKEHNENRSKMLQTSNSEWCEHSQPAMPGD